MIRGWSVNPKVRMRIGVPAEEGFQIHVLSIQKLNALSEYGISYPHKNSCGREQLINIFRNISRVTILK